MSEILRRLVEKKAEELNQPLHLPACPHADEPFLADLPAMATVADYEKALGIKPGTLQNLGTEPLSSPD